MKKIYIRKDTSIDYSYNRALGFTFKKNIAAGQTGLVWIKQEIIWNDKSRRKWYLRKIKVYELTEKYIFADIII